MKTLSLIMVMILGFSGCMSVQHAEIIDADKDGYASGQYRDVRSGTICNLGFVGGGLGVNAGGGAAGFIIAPAPTQGDPTPFARSIAMINYSRKLTKFKIDYDGIVDYEFSEKPLSSGYRPFGPQPLK